MDEIIGQEYVSDLTRIQKQIKLHLAKIASKGKDRVRPISYSALCQVLNLPYSMDNPYHRNLLSEDLGEISREEVDIYEWPMLSCLVIEKGKSFPARGFFTWAEELYGIKLPNEAERETFFTKEFNRTWEFWSSPEGKEEILRLENELNSPQNIS